MDSLADFDEDDDAGFFRRYEAEQASRSLSAFELDQVEPEPPSPEELARSARFRKPVALFVGAMSLLSLSALALRGAQPIDVAQRAPRAQRTLVAHYAAAIPASAPVESAAPAPYEPVAWQALSPAPSRCVLDPSAESAWLSIPRVTSTSIEGSAFRPSHWSGRGRRPAHSSASARIAAPKAVLAAPAPFTPVARFPDARQ